ncbi:hypothetical protein PV405_29985 [Streptomyces sp. ME02-6979-3A]|uniref:hypothetical protein n=1 Tax=Streptomyces sp. ME02-6979-3A TaxID=3028673 RepID=UPI0029A7BD42|nr:hypothetical protein [Streptomyces sp. ME02-6979-3A]MDX3328843.1 hypothetical protein [Streptomyces sp. ME02-6979-3A]
MIADRRPWDADDVAARRMTPEAEARLIQTLAKIRRTYATARDFVPGSPAHVNQIRRAA